MSDIVKAVEEALASRLGKSRIYVDSEDDVPDQYEAQEGSQGGIYYETEGSGDGGTDDPLDGDYGSEGATPESLDQLELVSEGDRLTVGSQEFEVTDVDTDGYSNSIEGETEDGKDRKISWSPTDDGSVVLSGDGMGAPSKGINDISMDTDSADLYEGADVTVDMDGSEIEAEVVEEDRGFDDSFVLETPDGDRYTVVDSSTSDNLEFFSEQSSARWFSDWTDLDISP